MLNIATVTLNLPLYKTFDYLIPDSCSSIMPGSRVEVPFGNKKIIGVVLSCKSNQKKEHINYKLKKIVEVIDINPSISKDILNLCNWASNYYQHPIGQVLFNALPKQIREGKSTRENDFLISDKEKSTIEQNTIKLNEEQNKVYEEIYINKSKFSSYLINGITGSGKTEVYIKLTDAIVKDGGQALIIVPEINLTPQTVARFKKYLDCNIFSYHSSITEKEKIRVWNYSKNSNLDVVIGTRSSIFLPFKNLKMIIVDEEHDTSLKQQEKFKYHARDLAIVRSKNLNIPIIIGSATPSFESLYNSDINKSKKFNLTKRFFKAELPEISIVDLNKDIPDDGISNFLKKSIETQLSRNKQCLLFIGRRGFSSALMCGNCNWVSKCNKCESFMTYHQSQKLVKCHHCGYQERILKNPGSCEKCDVRPIGYGTQRIEEKIKNLFPKTKIARIDSDAISNIKKLNEFIDKANNNEIDILIGTQMLVKGHDFPNVALVGIIDIDSGLYSLDFRGLEKTAQLITQVSGRSGRKEHRGQVIIQTRRPDHPLLHVLLKKGYIEFSKKNMKEREKAGLPPFSYISLIRVSSTVKNKSLLFLEEVKRKFNNEKSIFFYGPAEAPIGRKNNMYFFQILFGSKNRNALAIKTQEIRQYMDRKKPYNIRWSLDVDPIDLY